MPVALPLGDAAHCIHRVVAFPRQVRRGTGTAATGSARHIDRPPDRDVTEDYWKRESGIFRVPGTHASEYSSSSRTSMMDTSGPSSQHYPLAQIPPGVYCFAMATIDISEKTFNDTITGNSIVLVDFWAAWCGPCRMFAPTFSKASDNHTDVVFAKVDTEAEPGLSATARITSIPTLMAFRDGILVFSQPGAMNATGLEQLITAIKDLDMEEVRAKMAVAPAS
jgi:thioredoxin 1